MTKDPQFAGCPALDERIRKSPRQLIAVQVERLQVLESAEGFGKFSSEIVVGQVQPNDRGLAVVALSALYAVPVALRSRRSEPTHAMCPRRTASRLEERDQRVALGSRD